MTGEIEAILTYVLLSMIIALYVSNKLTTLRNLQNEEPGERGEDGKKHL